MAKIELSVRNELARAQVVDGVLTAREAGVSVEVQLIGPMWNGLVTTLVCRGSGVERRCLIQDGKSIVPWECLIGGEMLYIGVDGINEDGSVHIPSNFAEVQIVLASVAEADAIPENPPSPDIAAQIILITVGLDERVKALEQGGGIGMSKHILDFDGTHIMEDSKALTFAELYDMLMVKPDFCVLVYNNYAYHPNGVSTSQIVFSSGYPVNGYDRAHRITMLANGTVTATETESEHTSSRATAITEANKGSTTQYTSVKAVVDYVQPMKDDLEKILAALRASRIMD